MDRFWSKVTIKNKNECWIWKAGSRNGNYGAFKYDGFVIDSHRMAWFLTYGEFPDLLVCHTCDNGFCCNPNHLFLGTFKDNVDDMVRKGRQAKGKTHAYFIHPEIIKRGENNPRSKLNKNQVLQIKYRLKKGESCESISKDYSVSPRAIRFIKSGRTWL